MCETKEVRTNTLERFPGVDAEREPKNMKNEDRCTCWLALVKARFFNKVPLALRRQWSTPVPVVFLAVCLLDGLGTSNRGGLTASVVFVRGTFGQFSRSWSFTVVVVEVAHVRMFGSEVQKRIKGFDSLRVWVGARVPPHDCGGQTQRMGGGGSGGMRVVDRVCVCACVHVCEEEATKPNSFR